MKRHSIILLLIICLGIGCEDTNFRSSVPNVPVSYNLYITREHPHFIIDNGFQTMTITELRNSADYINAYANYVKSVRLMGASWPRILFVHILPNTLQVLLPERLLQLLQPPLRLFH